MERLITKVDNEYRFNDVSVESLKKVATRLGELEDKIENGTLVELPFEINQEVYFLDNNKIRTYLISGITINHIKPLNMVIDTNYYPRCENLPFMLPMCDYNKTWFTDKAKAEAKERNNGSMGSN